MARAAVQEPVEVKTWQVTGPDLPLTKHLRALISAGESPDKATDIVWAPYTHLPCAELRYAVLRLAYKEYGTFVQRAEELAFNSTLSTKQRDRALVTVQHARGGAISQERQATYAQRLQGVKVAVKVENKWEYRGWDKLTRPLIHSRIAMLEAKKTGLNRRIYSLRCADELLLEYGCTEIGEIDDWLTKLRQRISECISEETIGAGPEMDMRKEAVV